MRGEGSTGLRRAQWDPGFRNDSLEEATARLQWSASSVMSALKNIEVTLSSSSTPFTQNQASSGCIWLASSATRLSPGSDWGLGNVVDFILCFHFYTRGEVSFRDSVPEICDCFQRYIPVSRSYISPKINLKKKEHSWRIFITWISTLNRKLQSSRDVSDNRQSR